MRPKHGWYGVEVKEDQRTHGRQLNELKGRKGTGSGVGKHQTASTTGITITMTFCRDDDRGEGPAGATLGDAIRNHKHRVE